MGKLAKVPISVPYRFTKTRIFFILLRGAMGILLLSDVSFKSTYPPVEQFQILRAGLSPLNVSLVNTDLFDIHRRILVVFP
jgi:hypothetical protein